MVKVVGRLAAISLVLLLATVVPATPASAHSVGGVGATNFRTTLSALTPAVPGLSLRVIENGSKLELDNTTGADVIVAGYAGEPYARIGPGGVFLNDNSPATYLNADRYSTVAVPVGVDPAAGPRWRRVGTEPILQWHDHRVHWMLQTLPPQVAADPGSAHRVSSWTVVLSYAPTDPTAGTGGQRLVAAGSLDWVPGPSPWPWLLLAAMVAALVVGAAYLNRPQRALAIATAVMVTFDVLHGVGVMLVTTGSLPARLGALFGADALLIWPFAILAAVLLWRRLTRAAWLAAGVGAIIAATITVDDAPDLWRSSAPTQWPANVNRAAVAIVMGAGVGLVVVLPLLLRRHVPRTAPWSAPLVGTGDQPDARTDVAAPAEVTVGTGAEAVARTNVESGSVPDSGPAGVGRRQVAGLLAAGALGALAGTAGGLAVGGRSAISPPTSPGLSDVGLRTVPFFGTHQGGIVTPDRPQAHLWVAGFDLVDGVDAAALRGLLHRWSTSAARLTLGQSTGNADDSVTIDLGPAALTVTVGFGPSLFGKAGLPLSARPDALAPLPTFGGERLDPTRSNGDLGLVVAADDPVVVAHAARVLRRLATGVARSRWEQTGFNSARGTGSETATGRNLMGQVDGTHNPKPTDPDFAARIFASGPSAPNWMRGGSYLVVRRIRMLLDDWDTLSLPDQERVIGRRKDTGAPLSGGDEHTEPNYGATVADGSPAIAANAHMRLAAPAFNDGAAILRRGFSYVDQGESGLVFMAWQADPRHGFIPVQRRLIGVDALSRYVRHETSALFAMPGGAAAGSYVGQSLLEPG